MRRCFTSRLRLPVHHSRRIMKQPRAGASALMQIALQLRTRSPVAVARLVHRGGHILPERSPAEAVPSPPPPRPVPGMFSPSIVSSAARVLPPGPANGHSSNANGGADGEGGVGCGYRAATGASSGASPGLSDGDNLSGVGGSNITGDGRDGRDSSYYDEGADDDGVPSGFTNAPEELRLPRGDDADGSEVRISVSSRNDACTSDLAFLQTGFILPDVARFIVISDSSMEDSVVNLISFLLPIFYGIITRVA